MNSCAGLALILAGLAWAATSYYHFVGILRDESFKVASAIALSVVCVLISVFSACRTVRQLGIRQLVPAVIGWIITAILLILAAGNFIDAPRGLKDGLL